MKFLGVRSIAAVAMSICAFSVMGQGGLGFLKQTPLSSFTDQDFELMKAAASAVLSSTEPGTAKSWTDSANGNGGTIKLVSSFSAADGRNCRRLRIENHAKGMSGVYTTNVCQAEHGPWKIDPAAAPARAAP
jgi:hypothetical protein